MMLIISHLVEWNVAQVCMVRLVPVGENETKIGRSCSPWWAWASYSSNSTWWASASRPGGRWTASLATCSPPCTSTRRKELAWGSAWDRNMIKFRSWYDNGRTILWSRLDLKEKIWGLPYLRIGASCVESPTRRKTQMPVILCRGKDFMKRRPRST